MVEISTAFLIFIISITLVGILLKAVLAGYEASSVTDRNTTANMMEVVLDAAPFLAWSENKAKLLWLNKMAKDSGKSIENLGSTAFKNSEKNVDMQKFKIFNHSIDGTDYFFAFDSTRDPKPENPPKRFIQTMSATFAHLQVGIAVFDHKNELSLFNPALSQHLDLRPEWLLKKPSLPAFLDRLRDTRILPEPKDYTSWRRAFSKIERCAMKDDYREDWGLPDGRSLRVIGRPHPSGTVVFLFEDVTASLAMERDFRQRISNLKNTMDAATVGMIAFNRKGNVTFLNETIKDALDLHVAINNIQDFSRIMQETYQPTPIWGDLRQYVEATSERESWQAEVQTSTGDCILINFEPVAAGDTLCEFHFPLKINQGENVGLTCAAQ